MSRFKLSVASLELPDQSTPSWKPAPAFTVEYYLTEDSNWERPVRMLLRNGFTYQRTEFHDGEFMTRSKFRRQDGVEVWLYHTMRHAEFRIRKAGKTTLRRCYIDAFRLYTGLRRHFTFQSGRSR